MNDNIIKGEYKIARKLREWYPGAIYHLMHRGVRRTEIFSDETDYQVDSGYIDGEALFWKDGCLFSVKETQDENPVTFNLPSFGPGDEMPDYSGVRFDAEKWRSGLGAYFFTDCTAVRNGGGQWGDYTVGAEAIA